MTTLRSAVEMIKAELKPFVDDCELRQYILLIFDFLRNCSQTDLILKGDEPVSDSELQFIHKAVKRLKQLEPIQYVLGQTEFAGLVFKVDGRVLIPRPETEELVEWILCEIQGNNPLLLDIGTGSGCIAITVKKNISAAEVHAWDISGNALEVAIENAYRNQVNILFKEVDILNYKAPEAMRFDVIVSNPPYITPKEKNQMAANVLNYEPHSALFVTNSNPLLFYDIIAGFSIKTLSRKGKLFLEINQAFGKEVIYLLKAKGFGTVEMRKDLSGHDRMIMAVKH